MVHPMTDTLRITEIFQSLQGESRSVGWPTVFIRLTGCPLRCGYCDTAYAFHGGETLSIDAILERTLAFGARHVTVTGGEPLAQKRVADLLRALCDAGKQVSLETSGALDVSVVDPRVVKVMDVKTPGSGEARRNLEANLDHLGALDQVKYVICDEADYRWAVDHVCRHRLTDRCEVLFSPSTGELEAQRLADWILRDGLDVRFQLQLHKILWGDVAGK